MKLPPNKALELTGIDGTAPRQHQWAGSSAPYR